MSGVRAPDGALVDNLVIPQGSQWNRSWPVTDNTGSPVVLTGWTLRSQIRPYAGSTLVLFEWNTSIVTPSSVLGVAVVTGSTAQVNLSGTGDSAAWTFVGGVFDVYLTDPAGHPTRIVEGSVTVTPQITY